MIIKSSNVMNGRVETAYFTSKNIAGKSLIFIDILCKTRHNQRLIYKIIGCFFIAAGTLTIIIVISSITPNHLKIPVITFTQNNGQ